MTDVAFRRLVRWFEASAKSHPENVALEVDGVRWTYASLDKATNGIASALRHAGICAGKRVGLSLARGASLYLALLGIQKAGASYVPIDSLLPGSRRRWIAEDAAVSLIFGDRPGDWAGLCWDANTLEDLARRSNDQAPPLEDNPDDECYVLYTSGTTGFPKGVPITEGNICAFMTSALPVYAVKPSDRVYQGVSLSFDFAIEELWPAWAAGGTLVASGQTPQPIGGDLNLLLRERKVSVFCAVPTVLATLASSWPELRQVVVSGEACPPELVNRWALPGIRMLNAYGPTEITVSATIGILKANEPVTLGRALPHLELSVRDNDLSEVPDGQIGELCVAGSGVAAHGYLNRPDETAKRFVPAANSADGGKMYRTGDLVRRLPDGQYVYHGRTDDQIKLRGQRIEPGEIESVLLKDPAVANAAVVAWSDGKRPAELAGYVRLHEGCQDNPSWREDTARRLASQLPQSMRLSLLDVLADWPMLANGKTDRRRLPQPTGARLLLNIERIADHRFSELGEQIRAIWCKALDLDDAPAGADFFADLGGHSMSAAIAVSRIRQELGISRLSVSDLYRNPRLEDFVSLCNGRSRGAALQTFAAAEEEGPPLSQWPCGFAQLAVIILTTLTMTVPGWYWVRLAGSWSPFVALTAGVALAPVWVILDGLLLPVVVSRIIGRLAPGRYPLWGIVYFKFWTKRKLLQMAPGRILAGHPLWPAYLRLLGARIGPNGVIASAFLALPELLDIGANVHIDADAALLPYEIADGWLTLSPIKIGDDASVGCGAMLQCGAVLPEAASLEPQSALFGKDTARAGWKHLGNLAKPVAQEVPLARGQDKAGGPKSARLLLAGILLFPALATWPFVLVYFNADIMGWSTLLLAPLAGISASIVFTLYVIAVVRICLRRKLPSLVRLDGADYRRKWAADRAIALHQMLLHAVYDTIFTPTLLRAFGVSVGKGAELSTVSHFDPSTLKLGEQCFVADLAAAGAPRHRDGYMCVEQTVVGNRAFVGNRAVLPAGARLNDGVLLGVHSYSQERNIKSDCLGVPAFDLPRRDLGIPAPDALTFSPARWRLAARAGFDFLRVAGPPAMFTLSYLAWFHLALNWHGSSAQGILLNLAVTIGLQIAMVLACMLAKWIAVGRYRVRVAPLWTNFVWRAQFVTGWYEAIAVPALLERLTGTPWLALFLRGFGCRIGRGVYLDSTFVTEFDLLQISEGAEIGEATALQTHLFEDRVMKCGAVHIEQRACVGSKCVVLYGGSVGKRAKLCSLSLAMKGEQLSETGTFRGVPAEPVAR